MIQTIRQVLAIARTEFRFAFRRGAPVVVTALIGLIVGSAILFNPIANLPNFPRYDEFSPEQVERMLEMGITETVFQSLNRDSITDMTASSTVDGWFLMFLALLLLPIATAGIVPADRQFGMLELLRSTPITATTYLAGKILGTLGIVFFIALFPLLIFLIVLEGILLNTYQAGVPLYLISFYIKLAIMDGIPLLACGAIIGILTGVALRTRRAALFPGLLAGMACFYGWIKLFQTPGLFVNTIDKAAVYVLQGYQSNSQASWDKILRPEVPPFDMSLLGANAPVIGIGQVLLMYAVILVILAGLTALARLWLQWKENF